MRNGLSILCGLLATAFLNPNARAEEGTQCIQRQVTFDAITPLRCAKATSATERIYLHAQYPAQCTNPADAACKSSAYILPGDDVAIGKSCGTWAYVQYITSTHYETMALLPLTAVPPARKTIETPRAHME
jgi:hypothetical protein